MGLATRQGRVVGGSGKEKVAGWGVCIGEGVGSSEEASGLQQIRMFVCSSLPSLVGLLPLFGGVIAG